MSFELSLILKAIECIVEIAAGILVIFVTQQMLHDFVYHTFSSQMQANGFMAHMLNKLLSSYTKEMQNYGIFYLISHGAVKLVIVFFMWKKKLWAYPASILVLILFIATQAVQMITGGVNLLLIYLTVLDLVMIWLTVVEFNSVKAARKNELKEAELLLEVPVDAAQDEAETLIA